MGRPWAQIGIRHDLSSGHKSHQRGSGYSSTNTTVLCAVKGAVLQRDQARPESGSLHLVTIKAVVE